jgi:lysophospholipase
MLGVQTGGRSLAGTRLLVRITRLLGGGRRYLLNDPGKPFDDDFEANVLTHDRRRYERGVALIKAEPKLALGAPTWDWLDFALKACAELARPERLSHITAPVVILSAEEDRLVDNAAQQAAARGLPQGKFVSVPGAYHEILMESDPMRNIFLRVFDALTGRVAPKPAEPPTAAAPTAPKPAPAAAAAPAQAPAPASASSASAPAAAASKPAARKAPSARKPAAPKKPAAKAASAKPAAAKKAPARKASAAEKTAAKKPATQKSAAAKAVARKPAGKASPAKASSAKAAPAKVASGKAASGRAAGKASPAKKPAAKAAAQKPAAKKPPAKKPAARKPAARKGATTA